MNRSGWIIIGSVLALIALAAFVVPVKEVVLYDLNTFDRTTTISVARIEVYRVVQDTPTGEILKALGLCSSSADKKICFYGAKEWQYMGLARTNGESAPSISKFIFLTRVAAESNMSAKRKKEILEEGLKLLKKNDEDGIADLSRQILTNENN